MFKTFELLSRANIVFVCYVEQVDMTHHFWLNTNSLSFFFFSSTDSEHSYYNLILKKAGQFVSNLQINLLKFALSIRAYSPTVQMFQQVTILSDIFGTQFYVVF